MSLIDDILASALPAPLKSAFGDLVTYRHMPGGTTQSLSAIITDALPERTYPGKVLVMEIVAEELDPSPEQGDQIVFNGTTYVVTDVKVDSLFAKLSLRIKSA